MLVCCFGKDPKKVYKDEGHGDEQEPVASVSGKKGKRSGGKKEKLSFFKRSFLKNEDNDKRDFRTAVVGYEERNLKHFFKHARLLTEDPLNEEEMANVLFIIRRQRLNDLLIMSNSLKLAEHSDDNIKDIVQKVNEIAFELEAPLETKSESNNRIMSEKANILTLATYVAASTPFKYETFEAVFEETYKPTTAEILAATEDGAVSDWAPATVKLLDATFIFQDTLAGGVDSGNTNDHKLMIVILSSLEILKKGFEDYLNKFRMHVEPGLVPGGPTFVFLLTQVKELKKACKKKKLDYMKKIEEATKMIVEMWCEGIEEKDFPQLNLPLVTFVDLMDVIRFKMVMMDIARLFSSEKYKFSGRRSVFLTEHLFGPA